MLQGGGGWTWQSCLREASPAQHQRTQGFCLRKYPTVMKMMTIVWIYHEQGKELIVFVLVCRSNDKKKKTSCLCLLFYVPLHIKKADQEGFTL